MKIAIMGTGGVGGYFGGLLAKAGNDVTFIARGEHLKSIQAHGLRIMSSNDGNFTVHSKAIDSCTGYALQDLILFTVKMYHNKSEIETIKPIVGDLSHIHMYETTRLRRISYAVFCLKKKK